MDNENQPQEERLVVIGAGAPFGKKKKEEDPNKIYYPSFTWRLFASTIDILITSVLIIPVLAIFVPAFNNEQALTLMQKANSGQLTEEQFYTEFADLMIHGGGILNMVNSLLIEFLLVGILVLLFWVFRNATPGKMLLGMKIVDDKTNGPPSKKQLFIRYAAYLVSGIPVGLGFLWIIFNKKRRGWHDYLSGTSVVYKKKPRFLT